MYYSTGSAEWHQPGQPATNFHQQLYPTENRFLTDNLFHQYRALPPYYPDYHHAAVAAVAAPTAAYNGYLDVSSPPPRYGTYTYVQFLFVIFYIVSRDSVYSIQKGFIVILKNTSN
jgi:hypothetical protein